MFTLLLLMIREFVLGTTRLWRAGMLQHTLASLGEYKCSENALFCIMHHCKTGHSQ